MFELKPLSRDAIPAALAKAERYRLLNEPVEAESICRDVLHIDPENQEAIIMLLLALTDQFDEGRGVNEAREVLSGLRGEYERAYYAGIICERRAKAHLRRHGPGARFRAYDYFQDAMRWYEKAEALRPPGNDDALLRWNACARLLMRNRHLERGPEERMEPLLSE